MRISSVELREICLPLIHPFETSFGRTEQRRIILVRVTDSEGVEGWGECTAGEGPFYSEEWIESAWDILTNYLAPTLINHEVTAADNLIELFNRIRGNRMAKATLETACWDLEAKRLSVPLWRHLGGVQNAIPCGVSIGIQESIETLIEKISKEIKAGYQRIKVKIKPGWDLEVLRDIRAQYPKINLMADANSAYTLSDLPLFRKMDELRLMMIEQPLAYDDLVDHARLQKLIKTSICLDEPVRSSAIAEHALDLHSCKIINLKLGRVGGHTEARKIERICRLRDVPVWAGGMLESGIGRAHNIAMATLEGFTLPGDVSASSRYWLEDIIDPPVTVTAEGTILAPEKPGIGFEVRMDYLEKVTVRKEVVRAQ